MPVATAAAPPPDEPPGVLLASHGFLVRPKTGFVVCQSASIIATLVFPRMIAPAARRRSTSAESALAGT